MTQFRPNGESPTGHTVNAPDSTNCFKPLLTLTDYTALTGFLRESEYFCRALIRKLHIPNLTPCVEIKKANLYRGFHESILGRFSNAAVDSKVDTSIESPLPRKQKVTWSTNGHRGNRLLQ